MYLALSGTYLCVLHTENKDGIYFLLDQLWDDWVFLFPVKAKNGTNNTTTEFRKTILLHYYILYLVKCSLGLWWFKTLLPQTSWVKTHASSSQHISDTWWLWLPVNSNSKSLKMIIMISTWKWIVSSFRDGFAIVDAVTLDRDNTEFCMSSLRESSRHRECVWESVCVCERVWVCDSVSGWRSSHCPRRLRWRRRRSLLARTRACAGSPGRPSGSWQTLEWSLRGPAGRQDLVQNKGRKEDAFKTKRL